VAQPFTIQFGPWTPDLANVPVQVPQMPGPIPVPCADCLNVYHNNGVYKSLPTQVAVSGSPALAGQCVGAFTFLDSSGTPIPIAGSIGTGLYAWMNSAWATLFVVAGGNSTNINFCQFGANLYSQYVPQQIVNFNGVLANLYALVPGAIAPQTPITAAPWGTALGVVGQFVMVGDVYIQNMTPVVLGTGDGVTVTFSGTLTNTPLMPTSIQVADQGGSAVGVDNGAGVISGTGIASGTVGYASGIVSVTFSSPPANGHQVSCLSAQGFRSRLRWSAIGDATSWPTPLTQAAIAAQSGQNDLEYEFGPIMFIAGYPLYALIFQREAITRATYQGGNVVFSWGTYERKRGLLTRGGAVQVESQVYFLSDAGFFVTDGANVIPIGTASDNSAGIDNWFWSNVNTSALSAIRSGYDAQKRCVFWAIPTGGNTLPDTLLIYNILSGRWTRAAASTELVWSDNDGSRQRLGVFDQSHNYSLLTGSPSSGYLESCDIMFSDGNTRTTISARPNGSLTSPTVTLGNRNTLTASVSYSSAVAPDAFGGGFAPVIGQGLYTRARVTSTNASAMHGATLMVQPGGPV